MKSLKFGKIVIFTGIFNWGLVLLFFLYSSILGDFFDLIIQKISFMQEFFFAIYFILIVLTFLTILFSLSSIVYLTYLFIKKNTIRKSEITKGFAIHIPYLLVYVLLVNAIVKV